MVVFIALIAILPLTCTTILIVMHYQKKKHQKEKERFLETHPDVTAALETRERLKAELSKIQNKKDALRKILNERKYCTRKNASFFFEYEARYESLVMQGLQLEKQLDEVRKEIRKITEKFGKTF